MNTKIERAIVAALIDEAGRAGFVPVRVYDGGEQVKVANAAEAIEAVFAVDESTIHFAPAANRAKWGRRGVFLVCGNGTDIISDWHCGDADFDAAIRRAVERTETLTVS